jgi:hypothetical protein
MFRMAAEEPEQRRADVDGIRSRLEALGDLDGVLSIRVHEDLGEVGSHWNVVLVADYASTEALSAYQVHPRHAEAVTWIDGVVTDRAVVDFEVA